MPWITAAEARHAEITERMNACSDNRCDILRDLLDLERDDTPIPVTANTYALKK